MDHSPPAAWLAFVWVAVALAAVAAIPVIIGSAVRVPTGVRVADLRDVGGGSGFASTGGYTVGRVSDVLYQGYHVVNSRILRLADGHEYFTSSIDGGRTWTRPVLVGGSAGRITINEWWNDGSIAADSAGDLYAAWDTQATKRGHRTDTGWVSFSTNGGRDGRSRYRVRRIGGTPPHIMEIAGAGPGTAYVGWLSSSDARGFALYLRRFSTSASGWLSGAVRVSRQFRRSNRLPWGYVRDRDALANKAGGQLGQRHPTLRREHLRVRRAHHRATSA